jgi:hypothetical protein
MEIRDLLKQRRAEAILDLLNSNWPKPRMTSSAYARRSPSLRAMILAHH